MKPTNQEEHKVSNLSVVLTKLMHECDIDDATLCRETGVPASTISRMRLNTNANPTAMTLLPIATFFGITIDQLIGASNLPKNLLPGLHFPLGFTSWRMPILKWEWIESWINGETENFSKLLSQWISTEKKVSDKTFALRVPDRNFGVVLRKGSIIIIDPAKNVSDRDIVLLKPLNKKEIMLKQIIKDDDDIYVKSLDLLIKGIKPLPKDYLILGSIIEIRQALVNSSEHITSIEEADVVYNPSNVFDDILITN